MGTSKTGHINPNSPQTSHNCDRPTSASENQSTMPPTASDNVNNHNNDTYQHPDDCFVEVLGSRDGQMVVLSRRLPSGRMIHIDTMDGAMLNGGVGLAHLNMDNSNNRVTNLAFVNEQQARHILMSFSEDVSSNSGHAGPNNI